MDLTQTPTRWKRQIQRLETNTNKLLFLPSNLYKHVHTNKWCRVQISSQITRVSSGVSLRKKETVCIVQFFVKILQSLLWVNLGNGSYCIHIFVSCIFWKNLTIIHSGIRPQLGVYALQMNRKGQIMECIMLKSGSLGFLWSIRCMYTLNYPRGSTPLTPGCPKAFT